MQAFPVQWVTRKQRPQCTAEEREDRKYRMHGGSERREANYGSATVLCGCALYNVSVGLLPLSLSGWSLSCGFPNKEVTLLRALAPPSPSSTLVCVLVGIFPG